MIMYTRRIVSFIILILILGPGIVYLYNQPDKPANYSNTENSRVNDNSQNPGSGRDRKLDRKRVCFQRSVY